MQALCGMWGREGDILFHRYYRSYIRAFNERNEDTGERRVVTMFDYLDKKRLREFLYAPPQSR